MAAPTSSAATNFLTKTTQTVVEMMTHCGYAGSGRWRKFLAVRIAGKTGTEKANIHGGGYRGAKITSFIGIVPVESPRYVVAVVDEPKEKALSSAPQSRHRC